MKKFLPFWFFLLVYKFGGTLHYSLLSPLGEKLFPLWAVGTMIALGSLVQLVLDVPAGHWLDRFGYLRLLKFTAFIFSFAGLSLLFGLTKISYIASLTAATFGWLFFGPGVSAYVLSHAPKASAGKFLSLRDTFESVGVVLASAVLTFVLTLTPRPMGLLLGALMLIALVALFFSPREPGHALEPKVATHGYEIRRAFLPDLLRALRRLNPASTMLLILGVASSTFYGVIWFVVPIVIAHQASSSVFGFGLGVFDFAIVVLGFILGNLADKGNKRAMVFFGLQLFAVAGILLGFHFGWLFLLFGFLATTGDEMASISLWSWLHALDRDHAHDGIIAGAISLFHDLGWALGPFFGGILYPLIGPSWTIASGAFLICMTWVIYQWLMRGHHSFASVEVPPKPRRLRVR